MSLAGLETAEVLDSSVPAVNSALQRARATLASTPTPRPSTEAAEQSMLSRYLNAWEKSDIKALISTLRDDASLVMPPMPQWFKGAQNIEAFLTQPFIFDTQADAGRYKGVFTRASGFPAIALFRRPSPGAPWVPDSLHVLELDGEKLGRMVVYVTPSLHPAFGISALP